MMLRAALAFFTRLPVGSAPLPSSFRGIMIWFPVVGLIVGGLAALLTGVAALRPARAVVRRPGLPCLGPHYRRFAP